MRGDCGKDGDERIYDSVGLMLCVSEREVPCKFVAQPLLCNHPEDDLHTVVLHVLYRLPGSHVWTTLTKALVQILTRRTSMVEVRMSWHLNRAAAQQD